MNGKAAIHRNEPRRTTCASLRLVGRREVGVAGAIALEQHLGIAVGGDVDAAARRLGCEFTATLDRRMAKLPGVWVV